MTDLTDDELRRLADFMDLERARRGDRWDDVARRAGVSVALLRNIRKGRAPLTLDSKMAIQRAYNLPDGYLDTVLAGKSQSRDDAPEAKYPPGLRDDTERQLWDITDLSEERRWEWINKWRRRQETLGHPGATQAG